MVITARIAREQAAADSRVTVVDNPSGRIPAGNNAAIKASRFPVVARVDGHALLPPGYLKLARADPIPGPLVSGLTGRAAYPVV